MDVPQHLGKPFHVGFLEKNGNDGDFPFQRAGNLLGQRIAARLKGGGRDHQYEDVHALQRGGDFLIEILAGGKMAVAPHGAVVRVEDVSHHVVAKDLVLLAIAQKHDVQSRRVGNFAVSCAVGKGGIRHETSASLCQS